MSDEHHCHARGCPVPCRPEHLMCGRHWMMVPPDVRRAVLLHYRVGQCDDKEPSAEWFQAADAAIGVVAVKEGRPLTRPLRDALTALAPEYLT